MVKVDRLTYFLFFWCIGSTISKLRFPFGGPLRSQELFMVLSCQWKLFEPALTKPTFKGDICIVRASWGGGGKHDRPQGFARKEYFCTYRYFSWYFEYFIIEKYLQVTLSMTPDDVVQKILELTSWKASERWTVYKKSLLAISLLIMKIGL